MSWCLHWSFLPRTSGGFKAVFFLCRKWEQMVGIMMFTPPDSCLKTLETRNSLYLESLLSRTPTSQTPTLAESLIYWITVGCFRRSSLCLMILWTVVSSSLTQAATSALTSTFITTNQTQWWAWTVDICSVDQREWMMINASFGWTLVGLMDRNPGWMDLVYWSCKRKFLTLTGLIWPRCCSLF